MDISVCGATFVGIFSLLSHNSFYRIHLQCFTLVMTMAVVVLMVIHFAMCCIFAIFAFSFLPFLFADFFFWVDTSLLYPNLVNRRFLFLCACFLLIQYICISSSRANLHFIFCFLAQPSTLLL